MEKIFNSAASFIDKFSLLKLCEQRFIVIIFLSIAIMSFSLAIIKIVDKL